MSVCLCAFRDILITDLAATVTFVELCEEVKTMCSVASQQPITLKWIDDEGGCASQSQVLSLVIVSAQASCQVSLYFWFHGCRRWDPTYIFKLLHLYFPSQILRLPVKTIGNCTFLSLALKFWNNFPAFLHTLDSEASLNIPHLTHV